MVTKVRTPWQIGYEAREQHLSLEDNPYDTGSLPACEWFAGYDIADTELPEL